MLASKWNLPDDLRYCMSDHHGGKKSKKTNQLLDCVQAANIIANSMKFGYSGGSNTSAKLPKNLRNRFGTSLKKLIISLGGISDEIDKARMVINIERQKGG